MRDATHGGKGSRRRKNANDNAYRSNYDKIFGDDKVKDDETKQRK